MSPKKIQDIISHNTRGREGSRRPTFTQRLSHEQKTKEGRIRPRKPTRFFVHRGAGGRKYMGFVLWSIPVFVLVFLVISFSTLFEKASLKITPRQETISVDSVFTAFREQKADALSFEVMILDGNEKKIVRATEVKQVRQKASGQIVIYNDFNSRSQRLIKNTRFETPDGLIYRIRESVVVSGQKTAGGNVVPGSIVATVYADEPGEKYNIGLTDFVVPGFRGTPRYAKFYARSKTEMNGGFVGVIKTVSQEELEGVGNELKTIVKQKLLENARTQVPDNFILFDDAVLVNFSDIQDINEQTEVGADTIEVVQRAKLHAFIFDKENFSNYLAGMLVTGFTQDDRVIILNLTDLNFTLINKEQISPVADEEIQFSLLGNPQFIWIFDEEDLSNKLAGQSKDELKSILAQFLSIAKAEVVLRPFWKQSFPDDPRDIKVEQVIEP